MDRDAHHQGLLHVSFRMPSKGAPSRFPSQSPHREGRSISSARLYSSLKGPSKEPRSWFPNEARMETDTHSHSLHTFIYSRAKEYSHHPRSPMQLEGLHTVGCAWFPNGIVLDTAVEYPSAMQPSGGYLSPWRG
jgi:hypothetical protein